MFSPALYTRLLNDPRLNKKPTRNMRLFISGSAPLLTDTHEEFEARTGTVGFALPDVTLKITDPTTGDTLPQLPRNTMEKIQKNALRDTYKDVFS